MKVFGIGLNKTGTTTLGVCFEILGLRHAPYDRRLLHQVKAGDLSGVHACARTYDGFEDWPWPLIYEELDARYPQGKFILTLRSSPQRWLDSLLRHSERAGTPAVRKLVYGHESPHGHEAEHLAFYERHNRAVQAHFADRPGKLLSVCWESGSGWKDLCDFLGLAVPRVPFPHANRRPGAPAPRRTERGSRP